MIFSRMSIEYNGDRLSEIMMKTPMQGGWLIPIVNHLIADHGYSRDQSADWLKSGSGGTIKEENTL